jgi:hypothetical protein
MKISEIKGKISKIKTALAYWSLEHPFCRVEGGSSDGILFVPIYGTRNRDALWFRILVLFPYEGLRILNRAKWAVLHRLHPKHRHHVVKTGLPPGYHDPDVVLLHACMAILLRHVEEEGGIDQLDEWTKELELEHRIAGSAQAERQRAIVELHRWWTVERPRKLKEIDEAETAAAAAAMVGGVPNTAARKPELSAILREEERDALHKLIDAKDSLWT